ncbi:MAG: hypothetical protein ACOCWJ_03330 [Verrucomicrobiota bacterium]
MIPQHKNLAIFAAVLLVVFAVLYVALIYPRQDRVAELRNRRDALTDRLRENNWPLDPERLESRRDMMRTAEDRFGRRCDQVMNQVAATFNENIGRYTDSGPDDFRNVVSRLDYREEYSSIHQELQEGNIHFDEEVLGLGETSDSVYVYQQLLHLWTVKKLADLALECQLAPAPHPEVKRYNVDGRGSPVSKISVLPRLAYAVSEKKDKPYLLELPVRLTLRGTVPDMNAFLSRLQNSKQLLTLSRIEVSKIVPPKKSPRSDRIEMTVECSAFFRLDSAKSIDAPEQRERKILPAGA